MKVKFLPLYVSFIFFAFGQDAHAQGGTISLNGSVAGNITSTTADIWDVTTNADGLLRVSLTTAIPTDLYLSLYDNDGTTLLAGPLESYNSSTVTFDADGLAPGIYHIKVYPFSTSFGSYTLTNVLFPSALGGDIEPNGVPVNAVSLALNNHTTGHVGYYYNNQRDTADWYKVSTNTDGLLRVYLATARSGVNSVNNLDVNVTLYDNDGITTLGTMEVFNGNNPASSVLTTDGLAPGTYYIKVQPYSTNEFSDYTITDSLFVPPLINDVGSNGDITGATVLPLNDSTHGHVGYYYNHQRDTTDWYKVTTTNDGLLRITLRTDRGSIYSNNSLDVNITLYDHDGTTPLGTTEVFNGNNPATNSITTDGLAAGTYYIKVQPYSTNEFADYTLSDSLFISPGSDIEPNGSPVNAVTLPLNDSQDGQVGYYYDHQRDTADWYKITTTSDGLLRVYLTTSRSSVYSGNALDVNLTLYDNDGITQLGNVEVFNGNNPASNVLTVDGLATGTYYVKVQPYSSNEFANYEITDSLFIPPGSNDAEPNGNFTVAPDFNLNTYQAGHSGYYYNHQRDTADWYKVTVTVAGPLYIYLSSLRGSIYSSNSLDMNLSLYSSDGTTQLQNVEVFNGNNPATNQLSFPAIAAGVYYVRVTDYSTSEFAIYLLSVATTDINLPVTYLGFSGILKDNNALLNWSTATEINNKGFEVEKSLDGRNFTAIGFVTGNGNSSLVHNYDFTDNKVASGHNYYRLKQIDLDGHFNYSTVIRLDYKKFDWSISGNPVSNNSWIQIQLDKTTNISFQIFTADGKCIKTVNEGVLAEGIHSIPLNVGNIPAGIYVIKLLADDQSFSKKILK